MTEYLPYVRTLASRVIIELLVHNFNTTQDLNERITELGFGNKNEITNGYKEYTLNILSFSDSNWKNL